MMAEIIVEGALAKRLAEFQAKLEAEKAAAAASTAAYQSQVVYEKRVARLMDQLALEKEIAAFEAQLEAELAAQEMMAEIIAEGALAKRLAEFQAKLEAEKAAAAASTAAYQSKLAYEAKVNRIMEDLERELELAQELDEFESQLADELVAQATAKLEKEKVVGAISGEIVTVAGHESCKQTLNLSDHNVNLFKRSLAGDYLYNVGPLNKFGTEFSASRWEKYINCIGSYNE
jgi:polysaccharide pyruvyl transferase WcaK-like protein